MSFVETDYGPVFAELLRTNRQRALDEGSPDESMRDRLQSLTVNEAFAHAKVVDVDAARCCVSAIWLLYDFLDDSHTISQSVATVEGSFWHGIMHRREGDFSNAKYWFRKVGEHPVYARLASDWDPFQFVDECQAALRAGGDQQPRCRQLQQDEFEALFDFCYHQAIGE